MMEKELSAAEIKTLREMLPYMNLKELKEACQILALPASGQKGEIIQRIYSFCEKGIVLTPSKVPEVSIAKKTLILKGAYKNDAKTRAFLKSMIGEHFHFTAFGQDWIKERWLAGNPPTYKEFADYWKKNMNRESS
jgi:hypothetical protein